ncbi:hypothetical protein C8J56DRAFT_887820 [Mycena floridula]|nr:hypothetical protein C8J56DRAFT_887820 [Mycena floridula]
MELTFVTDLGQSFTVEIDPNMELENVMALLEAESGIPAAEQSIHHENRELGNPKATMRELGVAGSNAMLLLRRKVVNPTGGRPLEHDAEMMRLQLLGDPQLMRQIRETQPELAEAAQSNPARFAELLRQTQERQYQAELAQQREIQHLNADPFDVEAQRKIEEKLWKGYDALAIEVNGVPVKAFVDSGAQNTITFDAHGFLTNGLLEWLEVLGLLRYWAEFTVYS